MPKKLVAPSEPWDVPIWDALVAELSDPRPYEPTAFSESHVPDADPWVDPDYFDDLVYEVTTQGEEAMEAVDGWREVATQELDKIHPIPAELVEWRNMNEVTAQFAAVT